MKTSDEKIRVLECAAKTGGQLDAITVLQVLAERKIDKAWIIELTEQKAKWVAWANEALAEADEVNSLREQVRLLTEQRDALVAEVFKLKTAHPQPFGTEMMKALDAFEKHQDDVPETGMMDAFFILRDSICVETPATDAAIAALRAEAKAEAIPEGYVLVPQEMHLPAESMEGICFHCGDGGHQFGEFTDGTLFVGEVDYGDGVKVYGLHTD